MPVPTPYGPYKTDAELGGGGGDPTDTGWRSITHADLTAGKVQVRRVGAVCFFTLDAAVFGTKSGTIQVTNLVPEGFYPSSWISGTTSPFYSAAYAIRFLNTGTIQIANLVASEPLRITMTFPVDVPIPATLPGTAA